MMNNQATAAASGKRVLALVTDAFGGHGGIAAYSRDVLTALCEDSRVREVVAVPRLIDGPVGPLPPKLVFDLAGIRGRAAFLRTVIKHALKGRLDLIYCAHVHHVPLAYALSKLTGAPWVLCMYGVEVWTPTGRRLVDRLVGRADLYLPLSGVTLQRFRKFCPIDPARAVVLHNAVHPEQFGGAKPKNEALAARLGLTDKTVLMTLGRLDPTEQAKGFDRVIELLPRIAAKIPDVAYLICGKGGDRPRLEALAKANGVADRVVFAGMVPEEEKPDHYRLADAYVMPSVLEGFGFVFIEALACGVPVVASSIDGGREAVMEGEIGEIVDPHDKDALEAAIYRALAKPRIVPEKLSYFSYPNFRERLQRALGPLLTDRGSGSAA